MEQGVGQDVAEDESVLGAPVAPSHKKVTCATCGSGFPKQSNLTRHVEAKHTDQTTPAAVARRKELAEYLKNWRKNGSATKRAKKKAPTVDDAPDHEAAPAEEAKEVAVEEAPKDDTAAPVEEAKADADASSASINEPSADAPEPDNRREGGGRVKKSRKKDKTKGVPLRVETTALTTANVISFFTPKYDAPRSKEQRAANPRPSAV